MTIEEIKELLHVFNQSGVGELEVQRGDNRIRIKRNVLHQEVVVAQAPQVVAPVMQPTAMAAPSAPAMHTSAAPAPDANTTLVKSPIVGTFYEAPSPGAPPFVRVGDQVEPGKVLCIIESMKLMNEIEAEVAGTIVSKLVENGKPVEYGEALFGIRPR